jgi:hypothetical protein
VSVAALITRRRLLKVGGFASAQLVVQVLGFASGIALVQFMEPTQYGHYTLAVSMVGLASVLLDLGLSTAVLAQGGPRREPKWCPNLFHYYDEGADGAFFRCL